MVDTERKVDWTYDPNEPRYCHCNQVSYGEMVACDNENVSSPHLLSSAISIILMIHLFLFE